MQSSSVNIGSFQFLYVSNKTILIALVLQSSFQFFLVILLVVINGNSGVQPRKQLEFRQYPNIQYIHTRTCFIFIVSVNKLLIFWLVLCSMDILYVVASVAVTNDSVLLAFFRTFLLVSQLFQWLGEMTGHFNGKWFSSHHFQN